MKKRIVCIAVAAVMMFVLMGCSVSSTVTKTETVTDSNGNTTTTTHTTTTQNGKTTESVTVEDSTEAAEEDTATVATIAFQNDTGVDIYAIKFTSSLSDDWGDNILGDNAPLRDGATITYEDAFTYSEGNYLWDMKIADEAEQTIEFRELDISHAADPEYITVVLTYNEADDSFTAAVE